MQELKEQRFIDVRILGIASLDHLLLDKKGIDLSGDWRAELEKVNHPHNALFNHGP